MATVKPNLADQHQRDLAATDLSCAYCVEAAAGTGKTTLLVDRLLAIVRSGKAELKDVVAITFTEKAAAELKVRLREKLEESRRQATGPVERDRFAKALEQLDRANLSTIHAFASSLLRERPVEAGVDPGFELLDEMGSQLLFDEEWQIWKEQQQANPPPVLRRLWMLEIHWNGIKAIAERLVENRDIVLQSPVTSPQSAGTSGQPPVSSGRSPVSASGLTTDDWRLMTGEIWNEVAAEIRKLETLGNCCTQPADSGFRQIQRLSNILAQTPADELNRERALLLDMKVSARCGAQGNWSPPSVCSEQKQICARLKDILENAPDRLGPSLAAGVLDWLKSFVRAVEQEKRARGVLDFQDLLLKARDLVCNHREVRAYFQQRIRFLLVDEFQDTDPLQTELVFFLAEQGAVAEDWRQVKLSPDKLFLVGDPKQSIYRFRRADIRIYDQAKQKMSALHEPLIIHQNFRSSPWLLQAINDLFQTQMVADDYQAGYVTLEPAPDRPNAGPGLALLFPPETYVPGKMLAYWQAEAELLARFIKHICAGVPGPAAHGAFAQADGTVRLWDKHQQKARTSTFRDIAVLFPATTGLPQYEDALRAYGVPFQSDAGRQYYLRRETQALLSVLNAVDNPEDAIAAVAALRSPFFGLSDEDLFLYRHAGGRFHYLRKPLGRFPRMAHSFEQLRRWHSLRAAAPLSSLVETILDESCALPFLLLLPDGEQAVANLLRIVDLARRFESEPDACLRSFAHWLEQRAASEVAEADTAFADEQENAVRLLTIHAAKGLEFPVVVLASLACNRRRNEDVLFDYSRGEIGLSFKCGNHRLNTANYEELAETEEERSRAEDLRLFYVAATRAKDCLVIPRLAPENSRRPRFLEFFESVASHQSPVVSRQSPVTSYQPSVPSCRSSVTGHPSPACEPLDGNRQEHRTGAEAVQLATHSPQLQPSGSQLETHNSQLPAGSQLETHNSQLDGVLLVRAEELPEMDAPSAVLRRNIGAAPPAEELVAPILAEREHWRSSLSALGVCPTAPTPTVAAPHPEATAFGARVGGPAKALGTAFHSIMRQVDLSGDPLLEAMIDSVAASQEILRHTALLREWVLRALASPLLARARAATRIWREIPFCIKYQGAVTEGYIDLLFEENARLILVDYKTEDVKPAGLAAAIEAHRPQLEVYREAVQQLTGDPPREVYLYFIRADRVQPVAFEPFGHG